MVLAQYIPSDMCSPTWETHILSYMCSPTWETHIPSFICSPSLETHIPSDICFSPRKHISVLICSKSSKSRKIDIFPEGLTYGFGPIYP